MTPAGWIKGLVAGRPDLYRAVYDWNLYPHRWIPADRLGAVLPAPVIAALEASPEGRARLGAHFRRVHGLEETLWDLAVPRRRLALLGSAALERLARFAGAVRVAPRLARVIAKDERRSLTAQIGEDAYSFALRRGPLLPGPGALPVDAPVEGSLPEALGRCGWQTVWDCVALEPEALRRRFLLKVPASARHLAPPAGEEARDLSWELVAALAGDLLSREEKLCFA
jgi:hypothetical protein